MSIIHKFEILEIKLIDFSYIRVKLQQWEWMRHTGKLCLQWFNVVLVDMTVTESVNEFSSFETADLSNHTCQ